MSIVHTPQSLCRFGIARCDITPPVGIYHRMWGAAKQDQATGVHRPLQATALIFEPEDASDNTQILVALDHVLLWAPEMDSLATSVAQKVGIAAEQVAYTFSHTHAAGMMEINRKELPGGVMIEPYLQELADNVAKLIDEARRSIEPVCITYGVGRCSLAAHRVYWDEKSEQFVCGLNPTGNADDTVMVARVTNNDQKTAAVIVNYACHPTTLAWDNTLISPDFPGAMREVVENEMHAPCVFLQGASGDLGPKEGFVGDVEVADRNGRRLAYAALSVMAGMPPARSAYHFVAPVISGATIGVWEHRPLDEQRTAEVKQWRIRRWNVDVAYRDDLPTIAQTQSALQQWRAKEQQAISNGNDPTARDCRAMIERENRRLSRLKGLPQGEHFPFPVAMWQMGDAIWLAVESELYQWFQQSLRAEFPRATIIVITLMNGSRVSYVPKREAYGNGIYQETVSVLAPGSLETIQNAVSIQIRDWLKNGSSVFGCKG